MWLKGYEKVFTGSDGTGLESRRFEAGGSKVLFGLQSKFKGSLGRPCLKWENRVRAIA